MVRTRLAHDHILVVGILALLPSYSTALLLVPPLSTPPSRAPLVCMSGKGAYYKEKYGDKAKFIFTDTVTSFKTHTSLNPLAIIFTGARKCRSFKNCTMLK